jgi:hypothetical protein
MSETWPDPERLDHLVDGGSPATSDEEDLTRLLIELRADRPQAPDALRVRVEQIALREPQERRRFRLPSMAALAGGLAPVMAAAAIAVAVWPSSAPAPRQDGRFDTATRSQETPAPAQAAVPKPSPRAKAAPLDRVESYATGPGAAAGGNLSAPKATSPPSSASSKADGDARVRITQGRSSRWPYVLALALVSAFLAAGALAAWLRRRSPKRRLAP